VDRDLSDPEMAKAVDEIRSALVYIPAQIYYNHGNYEEARRRLMLVRQRFPESSLALEASKTFLNTYIQEGDLQNIRKYTEYFQKNPVGPESERLAANGIFAKQQEQVDFVLAQKKSEAGDFAGAAQGFLDFMRDYPTSDYAKDAHFNAANNFDKLGKADEANRLFEQYIDKYPSDERSKNLYFRIAQNYSSTLDLNKALTYYDQLVKRFPDAESAPDAAFNAAFLRVGIGDHVNAAKNFEAYATRYPDKSDAEPAFWRAGEQWQLVGENDALAFYQRYLKTYPNGDPNHTIDALHSIAQIYEKRGNARQAAPYWAQIQQVYSSASPASLTARSRSLAAEGALNDLLAKYETFKVVKWTTNEQKNVDILKNQKPGELKALITQSRQMITTYQDYDTAAAAIYVEGMGLFAYADMAYNCPPPKGLSEDELAQYQDLVAQQLQIPFEDQGKARLIASLEKAKSEKRWSEWNAKAASELHKRYPKEFPSEERQESRATSSAVDLPFAGPTGAAAAPAAPAPAAPAPAAPAPATPAPGTPDPNTPPAPATPPGGN
jgi:TolA-binding protein